VHGHCRSRDSSSAPSAAANIGVGLIAFIGIEQRTELPVDHGRLEMRD
jgi:hypothetical protein